jgi:hypothetical protein
LAFGFEHLLMMAHAMLLKMMDAIQPKPEIQHNGYIRQWL